MTMQSDNRQPRYQSKLPDIPAGKKSTSISLYINLNSLAQKQSNTTSRVQIVDQPAYQSLQLVHEDIQL